MHICCRLAMAGPVHYTNMSLAHSPKSMHERCPWCNGHSSTSRLLRLSCPKQAVYLFPACLVLAICCPARHQKASCSPEPYIYFMHDAIYILYGPPAVPGRAERTCMPGSLPLLPACAGRRGGASALVETCARAQKVKSKGTHWICSVMLALGTCFERTSLCTSCAARGPASSV